mmetsp:Transcript_40244/g.101306  ORF Transcript_40244/g.101306 Transcript_40244/m.101306 type:complete len:271 (+) Transcript_40244:111-923(+)|eukprot:CAMPEP_0177665800 /NCGR_PEP_ID=MMETSP0447-20121125/21247_1 /TAXON_ID=0 /ORGANISM="Stygamoeba regulata, Strain BSH-02190019" /LENGTH=270 /DNA_ID=CAMNT_0019171917 /DNA_START=104 /DNA_END=916 /DNA_ORIENTATION=-
MTQLQLPGKAAVVTGGSNGLGRAICELLVSNGVRVMVADIDRKAGELLCSTLNRSNNGGVTSVPMAAFSFCDVTDSETIQRAIDACVSTFGRFDIMLNNAGIGDPPFQLLSDPDTQEWRRVVDINLLGVMYGTHLAIHAFRKLGTKEGCIVNTASMAGFLPFAGSPVYAATKSAVVHFSRSLEILANENIRVCAICPTFASTGLVHNLGEETVAALREQAGGRLLRPEEVARGMLYLIQDPRSGGRVMRVTVVKGLDYWTPRKVYPIAKL